MGSQVSLGLTIKKLGFRENGVHKFKQEHNCLQGSGPIVSTVWGTKMGLARITHRCRECRGVPMQLCMGTNLGQYLDSDE